MSSQLLLYSTVGEFRENSSDVSAYTSTTVRPAPVRITTRFVVRAVVLATVQPTLTSRYWGGAPKQRGWDAPFPPTLSWDHFFSGFTWSGRGGTIPSMNGPAESSRLVARCFWSSALDSSDAAVGLLPPALVVGLTFAWVAYVWKPGSTTTRNRALRGDEEDTDVDLQSRRVWLKILRVRGRLIIVIVMKARRGRSWSAVGIRININGGGTAGSM